MILLFISNLKIDSNCTYFTSITLLYSTQFITNHRHYIKSPINTQLP